MSDPMNIASTARIHTPVMVRLTDLNAFVSLPSGGTCSLAYSTVNGRPNTTVPTITSSNPPLISGLSQLPSHASLTTTATIVMRTSTTSVPQSISFGFLPSQYV